MIVYVLIAALTATSIISLLLLYRSTRSRQALERELLSIRARSPDEEIEQIKREAEQIRGNALIEAEQIKNNVRLELEAELRQKRIENDVEISKKEQVMISILENYKNSGIELINSALNSAKVAALEQHQIYKASLEEMLEDLREQIANESSVLDQYRKNQIAITEALRRKALEDDQYSITLTHADRLEVEDLQAIATRYPRVRQVLLKAIYDIYYAPEVKKLVSRVVGNTRIMGIYRITSRIDGRVYIGKSVDIRERWITHFKRAAGIETETTNLLYPAMRSQGLESFSFEIIEVVDDEKQLSNREKYWQEFYDAKTHGFSVK